MTGSLQLSRSDRLPLAAARAKLIIMPNIARRVGPVPLVLTALSLACGIPLTAADLTATAERTDPASIAAATATPSAAVLPTIASADPPGNPLNAALAPSATPTTATEPATATPSAVATSETPADAATPTVAPPPPATPTPISIEAITNRAVQILNEFRASSGLPTLRRNAQLTGGANRYARYMAEAHFFGHTGLDGSTPQSRIAASGYPGRFWGEALADGQGSAQRAINTWLNSPAHAAILLDPRAVDVGIGYFFNPADIYGHYWVLNTGVP